MTPVLVLLASSALALEISAPLEPPALPAAVVPYSASSPFDLNLDFHVVGRLEGHALGTPACVNCLIHVPLEVNQTPPEALGVERRRAAAVMLARAVAVDALNDPEVLARLAPAGMARIEARANGAPAPSADELWRDAAELFDRFAARHVSFEVAPEAREAVVAELASDHPAQGVLLFNLRGPMRKSAVEALQEKAAGAAQEHYLRNRAQMAAQIIGSYFREFWRPLGVIPHYGLTRGISAYYTMDRDGDGHIVMLKDRFITAENEGRTPIWEGSTPLIGRLSLLLPMLHELAHGLFDKITGRGELIPAGSVGEAMTEGFAVWLELEAESRLLLDREKLGLNEAEVEGLRSFRRDRLKSLKQDRSHYTDGFFYFFRAIHRLEGDAGVLRFVESLDPERFNEARRDGPQYFLIQRSVPLMKAYFAKDGDPRLRRGIDLTALYLAGAALDDEDLAAARAAAALVDSRSFGRLLMRLDGGWTRAPRILARFRDLNPGVADRAERWARALGKLPAS